MRSNVFVNRKWSHLALHDDSHGQLFEVCEGLNGRAWLLRSLTVCVLNDFMASPRQMMHDLVERKYMFTVCMWLGSAYAPTYCTVTLIQTMQVWMVSFPDPVLPLFSFWRWALWQCCRLFCSLFWLAHVSHSVLSCFWARGLCDTDKLNSPQRKAYLYYLNCSDLKVMIHMATF